MRFHPGANYGRGTTTGAARVMTRRILADRARLARPQSFFDQFANHLQELRVNAHGWSAHNTYAALASDRLHLNIEIENDFDVIGNEPDGDHRYLSAGIELANYICDVGFKPGLSGRPTAALINQTPVG